MSFMDIGNLCQADGCQVHDFLPFTCNLCDKTYCLEHRSRFIHQCKGINLSTSLSIPQSTISGLTTKPTVKEMFSKVENRFETEENHDSIHNRLVSGSSKEHYSITSSAIPPQQYIHSKSSETIAKLKEMSSTTSNPSTQKLSQKASEILMKSHAIGDSDRIEYQDRLYLTCIFPNIQVYVFYHRAITVGDFVSKLSHDFPQAIYGFPHKPINKTVAMCTDDTPDWKEWNYTWKLDDVLSPFETVSIIPIDIDESITNQQRFETLTQTNTKPLEPMGSKEIEKFKAGDLVFYMNASGNQEIVTVIAVHLDDFPNVYYTILPQTYWMNTTEKYEKQTDHKRLTSVERKSSQEIRNTDEQRVGKGQMPISMIMSSDTNNVGTEPFSIQIIHGSNIYYIIDINEFHTVAQLKVKLQGVTEVPWQRCKLICKGSVLRDANRLLDPKESKITNGCKVTMIGTK